MKHLRLLLLPFSWIYGCITTIRNLLYDVRILKSHFYPVPVISIGNLNTGGTGKTPHAEMLLRLLQDKKAVVVSRGYGRKSKGVLEVEISTNATSVGDEPLQMKNKFPGTKFIVAEKRTEGINYALKKYPETEVILLDDAFQHRSVSPGLSVLLTQYGDLYADDYVLPAGNLREFRSGAKRANVVMITKCPSDLSKKEQEILVTKISFRGDVYFSTLKYDAAFSLDGSRTIAVSDWKDYEILLITGIACAEKLKEFIRLHCKKFSSFDFGDHHEYCEKDFSFIQSKFNTFATDKKMILITEKDAVKFKSSDFKSHLENLPVYYLPVKSEIIENKEKFNLLIKNYVGEN